MDLLDSNYLPDPAQQGVLVNQMHRAVPTKYNMSYGHISQTECNFLNVPCRYVLYLSPVTFSYLSVSQNFKNNQLVTYSH